MSNPGFVIIKSMSTAEDNLLLFNKWRGVLCITQNLLESYQPSSHPMIPHRAHPGPLLLLFFYETDVVGFCFLNRFSTPSPPASPKRLSFGGRGNSPFPRGRICFFIASYYLFVILLFYFHGFSKCWKVSFDTHFVCYFL